MAPTARPPTTPAAIAPFSASAGLGATLTAKVNAATAAIVMIFNIFNSFTMPTSGD